MLYPFIERVWALRASYLKPMISGLNLDNTWKWFQKMSNFPWIQIYKASEHRLINLISLIKHKKYSGLNLPVIIYD